MSDEIKLVEHEHVIRLVVKHPENWDVTEVNDALRDLLDDAVAEGIEKEGMARIRHVSVRRRNIIQPRGSQEPGPWSGNLLVELEKNGFIPPHTRRVIIDIEEGNFVVMHMQGSVKNGDELMDVIMANIDQAKVVYEAEKD